MKKFTYLLFLAIGVTSCSVESMDSTENLLTADAQYKLTAATSSVPLTSYMFMSGGSGNEKAELTVSNTCDVVTLTFTPKNDDELEVKFDVFKTLPNVNVNTGNGKITLPNGTISLNETDLDENNSYSISFADLGVDASNDLFVFARMGNEDAGSQVIGDWEYFTYDITEENCGCDESFTYIENGDGTFTFTYTAGDDIMGAELTFTFAQGAYVSGLSDIFVQNGHNGQTYTTKMDLMECDVLTYTVTLMATCSGNSKESNVWTDFKVNDVSKKANPEDKFVATCN